MRGPIPGLLIALLALSSTAEQPPETTAVQLLAETLRLEARLEHVYQAYADLDEEGLALIQGIDHAYSGAHVNEYSMQVTRVAPGSPAAEAGVQVGDIVQEVNGVVGDGTPAGNAALLIAYRNLSPGDLTSVVLQRDGKQHLLQVPLISSADYHARLRAVRTPEDDASARLARREMQVRDKIYDAKWKTWSEQLVGMWDGVTLMSMAAGLQARLGERVGVLVVSAADSTHPLVPGDIVTAVGSNTPKDAHHAMELLYEYAEQEMVQLTVERGGVWLTLEIAYPEAETFDDYD